MTAELSTDVDARLQHGTSDKASRPPNGTAQTSSAAPDYASEKLQDVPRGFPPDDSSKAWRTLFDAMTEYDERMIKGWRDELRNLLVFAGLFSAVVTSFTAESYKWLSEDPAVASARLLAQISLQLSAAPVPLNATTLSHGEAAFRPTLMNAQINALWFLSLAVTLIVALGTILIQQWLREYPIDGTCARDGVKLRQFRYNGLMMWRVPQMVAVLPIMLQTAVVLFLVGLIIMLWPLDMMVERTINIFLTAAAFLLITTSFAPALFPSCPYKSPLALVACVLASGGRSFFWFVASSVVLAPFFVFEAVRSATFAIASALRWRPAHHRPNYARFSWWANVEYARSFVWEQVYDMVRVSGPATSFWRTRDAQAADASPRAEGEGLAWAELMLSADAVADLAPCLGDIDAEGRTLCAFAGAAHELSLSIPQLSMAFRKIDNGTEGAADVISTSVGRMDELLIAKQRGRLLDGLPESWDASRTGSVLGPSMLLVLQHMVKANPPPDPSFKHRYTSVLMGARLQIGSTVASSNERHRARVLARCLLDCCDQWKHVYRDTEAAALADWATNLHIAFFPDRAAQSWLTSSWWPEGSEAFLCASGAALHARAQTPPVATCREPDRLPALLACLRDFLEENSQRLATDGINGRDRALPVWSSMRRSLDLLANDDRYINIRYMIAPLVAALDNIEESGGILCNGLPGSISAPSEAFLGESERRADGYV